MEGEVALIDGVQGEENDRGYAKVLGLSDQGQRNQPHFKRGQKPGKHYLKQAQGIYYMAGRDCHYRPILVFDVKKVIDLELEEEECL